MTDDAGIEGRWPDLPGDILSTIYRHFSSSYDRARFASVCTSWHAAASWQPKLQPLPLLLPSTGNGSFDKKALAYSPEDGRVLHARLPWFPYGKRIVGSYDGGWVAAAIGCRIDVINLFTRASMLSKKEITCRCRSYKFFIKKIVFSEDPAAKGCILAAMGSTGCITLTKLGAPQEWFYCRGQGWTKTGGCCDYPRYIEDIVFCSGGVLYGISCRDDLLYKLAIGVNEYDVPVIIPLEEITIQRHNTSSFDPREDIFGIGDKLDVRNIFDLGGKLATAVEVSPLTSSSSSSSKARTFRVFELTRCDTADSYKCMWAELTSLGDHALFLGPGCCKALHIPAASMRGSVERNCIYYTWEAYTDRGCLARLDLGSCTVYCYESQGGVDRHGWGGIMSQGYHYHHREKDQPVSNSNSCTWIFPPQF